VDGFGTILWLLSSCHNSQTTSRTLAQLTTAGSE
jgi:hypothetical protein